MRRRLLSFGLVFLVVVTTTTLFGQATNSVLTGTVTTDGNPLPGVTVTITSPALLGTRTSVTGDAGTYNFPALPPGDYTVSFELDGMQKQTRNVAIRLAETARADADMRVSSVSEAITVTAAAPSVLETPQVSTNLEAEMVEALPVARRIQDRILIAPGVNEAGPNKQITINGAASMENLFMVNGVIINDNVRGQPQAGVIEDAIQETTLLTGGVSAEYGRFTGGVVSTITKSGGNEFSGSLRDNLTNEAWKGKTDFRDPVTGAGEADHTDKINPIYEATLGGRIIRDRLWFFLAGRMEESSLSTQTTGTNIPYDQMDEDTRWEAKLTGNLTSKHTLVASYLDVDFTRTNGIFGSIVDTRSLRVSGNPLTLTSIHYNGILTDQFLIEGQYSAKDFAIVGGGSLFRDRIFGTMIRDITTGRRGWSPTFCGVCKDKDRSNKDWLAKGTYFLSTRDWGSHNIVAGYDEFHELRTEDNYQSGSDFRVFGNFVYVGQDVFLNVRPTQGTTRFSRIQWDPLLGESQGSDFATRSFFVNDKWDLNPRWSFSAGVRYDQNDGKNQAGVKTVDDARFSPRLGAIYDVRGDGRHRFSASYGRYAAKIDQGPADSTSTGGRYATYLFEYRGPEINPIGPNGQIIGTPLPTDQVLQQVFSWFDSVGGTNASDLIFSILVPGLTERLPGTLKSPYMDEITLGYGIRLGSSGYLRADLVNRNWDDFYVTRRDLTTGTVTLPNGTVTDVGFIENGSGDNYEREYNGLQLQGNYKLMDRLTLGGNYTLSSLKGNVEGEEFNNATVTVGVIDVGASNIFEDPQYPQYTGFERNRPVGYLNQDMRHRANIWLQYVMPVFSGDLSLSVLERFHSGVPYSASAAIDVRQSATLPNGIVNPGYARQPGAVQYYFSDRGEYRLDDISATDFTALLSYPIWKADFFVKADLVNAFDQQGVEFAITTLGNVIERRVRTRSNGATFPSGNPAQAFNPFTDTPVEGVHWEKDRNFGKATNKDAYQLPRTYRFAVGIRF